MSEIEKQFFEAFGINKSTLCKYAIYGYEGEQETWYKCTKRNEECWTYPYSNTTCKDKETDYPEITNSILLKLICIAHTSPVITFTSRDIKDLKEEVLLVLCNWVDHRDIRRQVQTLFKGE